MKKLLMLFFAWLWLTPGTSVQRLSAQTANDTVRFGFFSDIHYGMTEYNGEKLYQNDWMRKALSGFQRRKAEFLFVGGDIVDASNNAAQYDMFDNEMITPLPWYPMPGNHDIGADPAGATMAKITAWNVRGYGRGPAKREFYGFTVKNLGAFFVLNTQAYISSDVSVRARADSQLTEMDAFFTANASIPNKIVCSHVPLFGTSQNEDSAYFSIGPTYRKRIIAIMNKHNAKVYLAGHRHENAVKTDGGITVYANTALSFQLGSGNVRGYYIYTMTKTGVQRDFYPLSSEPAANKWKWIAYGDTRTNDEAHRSVLQSIMQHTPDFRMMFNVGDCVEDGTNQALWNIWQKACDDILGGTGQKRFPPKYMAVPGNHEEMARPGALATWKFNLPGQQQFGHDGRFFYVDHENARFLLMDAFDSLGGTQGAFLNEAIRTNTKQWLFVIWHKPIFSYGDKAYEPELHQAWGVPLYQAGCDVIFTGHAHYYVRGKKLRLNGEKNPPLDPVSGTTHIVTGNGGAPLRSTVTNYDNNEYAVAYRSDKDQPNFFGYTELDMDGDTMILRHFSAAGVVMDSAVYTANAKGRLYRITMQTTGMGSIQTAPQDSFFRAGTSIQVTAVPALGWKFKNWNGALTSTKNPDSLMVQGDMDLSATFEQISSSERELRVNVNGLGSVSKNPAGPYYAPGTQVTLTATPAAGQRFAGWTGDTTASSPVITITVSQHRSVNAVFVPIQSYPMNIRSGSSMGSVTTTPTGGLFVEGTKVAVKAVPAAGWSFYAWTGDMNGTRNPDTLLIDGPKEVRPLFKKTGTSVYELPAVEDTYVRGGIAYQAKNFNADPYLLVREGSSLLNQARTYIKFDASAVQGKVLASWLKLHVKADGLPDGSGTVSAFPITDDSWSETVMKWSGAPAAGTILDSAITVRSTEKDYAIDATSYVASKMTGTRLVSFVVKDPTISDKSIQFDKREGASAPMLVVMTDQPTAVAAAGIVPSEYHLYQNYPNPFNPSTLVTFTVPRKEHVEVKVFDMIGKEVAVLQQGTLEPGSYEREWRAGKNSSGIYLCRLSAPGKTEIIRMTLLK